MLGLFRNEADYDKIQEDDTINFLDLVEFTQRNLDIRVQYMRMKFRYNAANHTYNEGQIGWFVAGSALNLIAAEAQF
jgi:aconitate hydratase